MSPGQPDFFTTSRTIWYSAMLVIGCVPHLSGLYQAHRLPPLPPQWMPIGPVTFQLTQNDSDFHVFKSSDFNPKLQMNNLHKWFGLIMSVVELRNIVFEHFIFVIPPRSIWLMKSAHKHIRHSHQFRELWHSWGRYLTIKIKNLCHLKIKISSFIPRLDINSFDRPYLHIWLQITN